METENCGVQLVTYMKNQQRLLNTLAARIQALEIMVLGTDQELNKRYRGVVASLENRKSLAADAQEWTEFYEALQNLIPPEK